MPPPDIPRAFDERLAPCGEFDVKRRPPGRAFDYPENVGQRQQAKDYVGKAKATGLRKSNNKTINVTGYLPASV